MLYDNQTIWHRYLFLPLGAQTIEMWKVVPEVVDWPALCVREGAYVIHLFGN